MNRQESQQQVENTFNNPFDEGRFRTFTSNLLKGMEKPSTEIVSGSRIKEAYRDHIKSYTRIGKYVSPDDEVIDVVAVNLASAFKLDRARTMQRNFIADYLKTRDKNGVIAAFYSDEYEDWRFSFIKLEYKVDVTEKGISTKADLTPARRYSFLVGKNEPNHTAQQQIAPLLEQTQKLSLADIEEAFRIESVTREFFNKYKDLFLKLKDEIDDILKKDNEIASDFKKHEISTANFAKKLMGQIVFLYFIQKKGWMGVPGDGKWGNGDKKFLRTLFERCKSEHKNFFNNYLEHLFYDALNNENRGTADPSYHPHFKCRIPFLNGGLFEPMNGYDWESGELRIKNDIFAKILDAFDLYNFTVREDEPLEKEVAVDPEMLGKVFENLLEVTDRKSKGAFYTPREIVHYMCQESLINFLDTKLNTESEKVSKNDIEKFIHRGDIYIDYALRNEAKRGEGKNISGVYKERELPSSIIENAVEIDSYLNDVKICDPAIGSGAFPVGMMNEIVRARYALSAYGKPNPDRNPYNFKRQCIQDCIYGVDIDPGAIDIAKLRLWLSLIVDEEDFSSIQPLPNLDYKIMCGNSLIGVDLEDMFMKARLPEIEKLKQQYFDETNRDKKKKLHNKINDILFEVTGKQKCFDFKIHFSEVFHNDGGFDVIIANPPYIGQKGNKEIFQEIKKTKFGLKYHQRRMDLFYFFIHMGVNISTKNGVLTFITTNYYLTATYSDKLRKHIKDELSCLKFINFNEFRIFESAQGQHNLISIFKKTVNVSVQTEISMVQNKGTANPTELSLILSGQSNSTLYFKRATNEIFEEGTNYIRLEPSLQNLDSDDLVILKILDRIKTQGELLGKYFFIEQGIVSGADKVSDNLIKKYPSYNFSKGEGIYVLTNEEVEKLCLPEDILTKYIKKTYKNSDIKRWAFCPPGTLNVIYIKSDGKSFEIDSRIMEHLDKYKIILINRNVRAGSITEDDYIDFISGNRDISYIMNANSMRAGNFYCLSYPRRSKDTFEKLKIVNPRRSKSNVFALEETGYYEQSDIVISTLMSQYVDILSEKYVIALLNSKLFYNWFYLRGKRKGEALEIFQKPLSEVPIKIIPYSEQSPFIHIVNTLYVAAKQPEYKLTQDMQNNIFELEHKLDYMVYELYGLTAEEIAIVENSVK